VKCPSILNAPRTEAGAACDTAGAGCITQDMAGARVDVATAISVAGALGVTPDIAAPLIMAIASGMAEGRAEKAARDKESQGED
jgi:hypothetical protein